MAEQDGVKLRAVVWSEICPWLSILRSFRLAIKLRSLVFGAVGILLTLLGWGLIAWLFSADPQVESWWAARIGRTGEGYAPWAAIDRAVPDRPCLPGVPAFGEEAAEPLVELSSRIMKPSDDPLGGTWAQLSQPAWETLVSQHMSVPALACLVLCALWGLAVWALFGGAISRIAAVGLAADERVGWGAALRYAGSKWLSYFAAPLFPLFGVALATVPLCILGLLIRFDFALLLVSILWPVLLLGGAIMAVLLLGLIFGWPLMWATISAEGTDTFDALSRSYAYVFQRPLRYLSYAVGAGILGALGWLLVKNFAAGIIWLTYWATSWGAGADRMNEIVGGNLEGMGHAGSCVLRFWIGCVKWLAFGYVYGYFWTAVTAIYFLLRRDVDATEMDEVYLDVDETEPPLGPPPLKGETGGAPAPSTESLGVATGEGMTLPDTSEPPKP